MNKQTVIFATLISLFLIACNSDDNSEGEFTLLSSYDIEVPEPSGLSFTADKRSLYTVSDKTNKIYQLSLTGELIQAIDCNAEDLEGITFNGNDTTIWVAQERDREIMQLNMKGETLQKFKLDIEKRKKNSGIEGLTINTKNGEMFCLNEKKPGLLIKFNQNGEILDNKKLDFAKDYSGIYHDAKTKKLWIVSDKSKTITLLDKKGKVEKSYETDVKSMEGIVVNSKKRLIYVVSDKLEKLFIFKY